MKFFSFLLIATSALYMTVEGCESGCTSSFETIKAKLDIVAQNCGQVQTVIPPFVLAPPPPPPPAPIAPAPPKPNVPVSHPHVNVSTGHPHPKAPVAPPKPIAPVTPITPQVTQQVCTDVSSNVQAISSSLTEVQQEIDSFAGVLSYSEVEVLLASLTQIQSALQTGFNLVVGFQPHIVTHGFADINVQIGENVADLYSKLNGFIKSLVPICPPKSHPKVAKVCKNIEVVTQNCCSAYNKTCN